MKLSHHIIKNLIFLAAYINILTDIFVNAENDNCLSPISIQANYNFLPFLSINFTKYNNFQERAKNIIDDYDYNLSEMIHTPSKLIQRSQEFSQVKTKSINIIRAKEFHAMKVENGEFLIIEDTNNVNTLLYSKWISDCTALAFKGKGKDSSIILGAAHFYPIYSDQSTFLEYLKEFKQYILKQGISDPEFIISYDPSSIGIDIFNNDEIERFDQRLKIILQGIKIYQRTIIDGLFSSRIHFVAASEGVWFVPVEINRENKTNIVKANNINISS